MESEYLPDRAFNGKNYIWRFWVDKSIFFDQPANPNDSIYLNESRIRRGDHLSFYIRSVSRDYVLFEKTLNLANNVNDSPFFTEPVILYSNVKNGYGIFTISNLQTVRFVADL